MKKCLVKFDISRIVTVYVIIADLWKQKKVIRTYILITFLITCGY